MILATATPVQLHPVELWDLLNVLAVNNAHVLGTELGRWRDATKPFIFDILSGQVALENTYEKWEYWKDPVPREQNSDVFRHVRNTLGLGETDESATNADFDRIDPLDQDDLGRISLRDLNPFTVRVIKRSRERLEAHGKLVRIEMVPIGDERPVVSTHSVRQALELAEEFSRELHKRNPACGFIKTLLQRRVGSSVLAGFNTATRMLAEREIEDEEGMNEEGESIYPLTPEEREMLVHLRDHLNRQLQSEGDPKFGRVLEVL